MQFLENNLKITLFEYKLHHIHLLFNHYKYSYHYLIQFIVSKDQKPKSDQHPKEQINVKTAEVKEMSEEVKKIDELLKVDQEAIS